MPYCKPNLVRAQKRLPCRIRPAVRRMQGMPVYSAGRFFTHSQLVCCRHRACLALRAEPQCTLRRRHGAAEPGRQEQHCGCARYLCQMTYK